MTLPFGGSPPTAVLASSGAQVVVGNCSVAAAVNYFVRAQINAVVTFDGTITFSNGLDYSNAFASASDYSLADFSAATFSNGSGVSGQKFVVTNYSGINASVRRTLFPGTTRPAITDPTCSYLGDIVYEVDVVSNGETFIMSAGQKCEVLNPPGAGIGTLTVVLPTLMSDGETTRVSTTGSIGSVTWSTSDGSTIVGTPPSMAPNTTYEWLFDQTANTWYPIGYNVAPGLTIATESMLFYVSTTGSDSNPGTSGEPFATIQRAVDVSASYYWPLGTSPTIRVADGTYNGTTFLKMLMGDVPTFGSIILYPSEIAANGILAAPFGEDVIGIFEPGANWVFDFFTLVNGGGAGNNINANGSVSLSLYGFNFAGSPNNHINASEGVLIFAEDSEFNINSGADQCFLQFTNFSYFNGINSDFTFNDDPAIGGQVVSCSDYSFADFTSATFAGSVGGSATSFFLSQYSGIGASITRDEFPGAVSQPTISDQTCAYLGDILYEVDSASNGGSLSMFGGPAQRDPQPIRNDRDIHAEFADADVGRRARQRCDDQHDHGIDDRHFGWLNDRHARTIHAQRWSITHVCV